jgi:hypothetical protein
MLSLDSRTRAGIVDDHFEQIMAKFLSPKAPIKHPWGLGLWQNV